MPAPVENGWFFPAEWQPHDATWVTWPHNPATWPHCFDQAVEEFAGLVAAISRDEPCHVIATGERHAQIRSQLDRHEAQANRIQLHDWPTNDSWVRDYGATFLVSRRPGQGIAAADFTYNGWGEKYPPFDDDQAIGRRMAQFADAQHFPVPMTFEGGAIETDGNGRLLTTRYCALNPNRNPGMSQERAEEIFRQYLGVDEVWWLPGNPIVGDDTDGHIDQIARFTASGAIVIASCDNPDLEDFGKAQENMAALQSWIERSSDQPSLVTLPMPAPIEMDGQMLPASYTNFYITNRSVLVPQFQDPNDSIALHRLAECFPERTIVPLASRHLADGLGSFHCLTQQQPAAAEG